MFKAGIPSKKANIPNDVVPRERRCDNPECTLNKTIAKLPKRTGSQFVKEPVIAGKPLVINESTTIFEVQGQTATWSNIKNSDNPEPLYRIVPNTHAHIINYVVVDSDSETLHKIYENDPSILRKLLNSQKQCADKMLKEITTRNETPLPIIKQSKVISNEPNVSADSINKPISIPKLLQQRIRSMQLPPQVHPELKITAVAGADDFSKATSNVLSTVSMRTLPSIKDNICNTSTIASASDIEAPIAFGGNIMKSDIDKMQKELEELRRNVALLVESQAKDEVN